MSLKYLIIGHGEHGKDEVAEIMQQHLDIKFQSSSRAACELFIFESIRYIYEYETVDECFNDRRNHRIIWEYLIKRYNKYDKARLAREIMKNNDMYVGMRSQKEYDESLKQNLFDVVIWVDASLRKPKDTTMKIKYDGNGMYFLSNNGELNDLESNVLLTLRSVDAGVV